jgi:hypothetical protein
MKPTLKGQTVRFHTPNADESPDQLYTLADCPLEAEAHAEKMRTHPQFPTNLPARVEIIALGTGFRFPPRQSVNLADLEVAP